MPKKRRMHRTKRTARRMVRHTRPLSKFTIVANNLLLFIALALVSLVLTKVLTSDSLLNQLFIVMAMVFGFISVAFFITLLILIVMKLAARKKKRR